jgi:hypothetical protein
LFFKNELNSQIGEISQGLSLGRFAGWPVYLMAVNRLRRLFN